MFRTRSNRRLPLLLAALSVTALSATALAAGAVAQEAGQIEFQRGYFLQTHEADYEGAAAAFEKVAADADAAAALRSESTVRLAQCREDLAAADFARLMPPETLAYVEITRPGRHVAQLLKMLGLTRDGKAPSDPSPANVTPLIDGLLYFPDDFSISPAWIAELDKLNGMAVAITSVDMRQGKPSGVAIIHPGDVNPLRGELESLVQLLEPDEPIDGYRTYQVQGQVWLTVTARMIIASDTREGVAATIGRLAIRSAWPGRGTHRSEAIDRLVGQSSSVTKLPWVVRVFTDCAWIPTPLRCQVRHSGYLRIQPAFPAFSIASTKAPNAV